MALVIGIKPTSTRTAGEGPEWSVGQVAGNEDSDGYKEYIYVKAAETITDAGYVCCFTKPDSVVMVSTANTAPGARGHGSRVGVAMAAITNGGYGWLQVYGKGPVRTLASAAAGTRLNSTTTAGTLDDDGTAGTRAINGVVLGTATGGSPATNTDAYLAYPTVGATI